METQGNFVGLTLKLPDSEVRNRGIMEDQVDLELS